MIIVNKRTGLRVEVLAGTRYPKDLYYEEKERKEPAKTEKVPVEIPAEKPVKKAESHKKSTTKKTSKKSSKRKKNTKKTTKKE